MSIYPNDEDIAWLKSDLAAAAGRPTVFCTHRLVVCPPLLRAACKRKFGVELLMPRAGQVRTILEERPSFVLALSGHCHTHLAMQDRPDGPAYLSTDALSEPPHEFRLVEVYRDQVDVFICSGRSAQNIAAGKWSVRRAAAAGFLKARLSRIRPRSRPAPSTVPASPPESR